MKLAKSKKKNIVAAAAVILCAIVLVLIFGHVTGDDLLFKNKKNLVVQSYVTMDESNINALTGGQIKDVLVEEGDLVTKGQELVRLDSDTLMAQREQAQAALAQAQAAYQSLLNGATEEQMKQLQLAVQIAQQTWKMPRLPTQEWTRIIRGPWRWFPQEPCPSPLWMPRRQPWLLPSSPGQLALQSGDFPEQAFRSPKRSNAGTDCPGPGRSGPGQGGPETDRHHPG